MATVHDHAPPPRPRPCSHCGGREVQTFGQGADATRYCMNPACGCPLAGPAPPWFPANDPAACRLCTRRRATHMVPTGGAAAAATAATRRTTRSGAGSAASGLDRAKALMSGMANTVTANPSPSASAARGSAPWRW
jgi:hypothetical protein